MSLSSTRWLLRLRRLPSFPPLWLCLRLCPPAPVPSLWLHPRRLSPVLLATVLSGAAVGAALCVGGGGPHSSSVYGTHPHAFVCPYFHQRCCSRGGHSAVNRHGCCGACSSSLSRLFQPPVSGLEDLGVVASSHRPVPAHSLRGHFPLSPGTHPVCSHVSPSGGLDGLRRSSGGVSSGSCASGISSLPALCGSWPHLPIQCFVLQSVQGPAGLPLGYDSCIRSSFLGYPYESLLGRLAHPGIVPGGPPPGSRGCFVPLSRVGDRGRPEVIPSLRLRWYFISGWSSTRGLLWLLHRQIASPGCGPPPTNSVLRSASCLLMAVTSGVAVLCHIWFQVATCG